MVGKHRGSCLCGAIEFEVDSFSGRAAHCHCSMCRRFHGAAYATFVSVGEDEFHWLRGREELSEFRAPNGTVRSFCRHCGSSLFFASPKAPRGSVEIALAAFEPDVPVEPDAHIFCDYRAEWTPLDETLPRHREGRTSPTQTLSKERAS